MLHGEVACLQPTKLLAELLTSALPHLSCGYLRTLLWRAAGLRAGRRARILGALHITGQGAWQDHLTIGVGTLITGPLRIDLQAPVHIGNRVSVGHDVMLVTSDHQVAGSSQRCGARFARPITIGDGAWLGSRCLILSGVYVGEGAIVAAGAVVTRDVPPDTLVAGVPAKVVRSLRASSPASGVRPAHANADTSRSPDLRAVS